MWPGMGFRKWFSRRRTPIQNPKKGVDRNQVKLKLELLEVRLAPASLYVDNPAAGNVITAGICGDFVVTTDQGTGGILDLNDTVTWNPGAGSSHGGAVAGLNFGTQAFGTIQDAINAGVSGVDTVKVGPGTFAENLVLNKSLTLLGNQFGVDARGRFVGSPPATESLISPASGQALELAGSPSGTTTGASFSIIDGFSFQGTTGTIGVVRSTTGGAATGIQFINNYVEGLTSAVTPIQWNKGEIDMTMDKNVLVGAAGAAQDLVINGPQTYAGLWFTNNNLSGANTGFAAQTVGTPPNRNIGVSGTRAPLFSGNLFKGMQTGFNMSGGSLDGATIQNNTFDSNSANGLQGGPKNTLITGNIFINNGIAIALTGFSTNTGYGAIGSTITQNSFSGSTTEDILISTNMDVGAAGSNNIFNNSLGSATALSYAGAEFIQASGNWWGNATGPTMATTNPTGTGGAIVGAGAANVDFTPHLNTGADTAPGTPGFQGDFSLLHVTATSPQSTLSSPADRINEAIGLVTSPGTVNVRAGTYAEAVDISKNNVTMQLGGAVTINSLTDSAATTFVNLQGNTLTVGDASNTAYDGVISGLGGSLTKEGVGALTLTNTNSYTGPTTINNGTLFVNGSLNVASAVSVNNNATLGGTGTVNGTVGVNGTGHVAPGTSPGILNTGNVTFAAGTNFDVEVNNSTPGSGHDQLNVTGTVALNGATLNATGTIASVPGQQIVLIKNDLTDPVLGTPATFNSLAQGATVVINAVPFIISYTGGIGGNDVTLTQAGPVTYTSDGLGAGALTLRRNANNVEFLDDGAVVDSRPLTSVTNITVNGTNTQGETLTVDYAFGGFFALPLTFHGGTGGGPDKMSVSGGSFTTLRYNATGVGAGNLVFDGATVLTFDGLEPVTVSSAAGTTTIAINDGLAHTAVITSGPGAGTNTVTIDGGLESMTFANPATELDLVADPGSDTFTINSLDAAFNAGLVVNGSTGAADTFNLNTALNLVGAVTIDSAVEATNLSANVTTTAGQSYGGPVTLGANETLTSTGAGNINLASTVNGAFSLTVNTAGTTTFGGAVGGGTALTSVATDAAGGTAINGLSVTTTGAQSFNDAVTLGANDTLTSTGSGSVSFASTVNGAFGLTVNTAGTTTFGGVVGGSTALSSLTTDAAGSTALNGGSVTTTGAQSYNDAVTLGANTTLTSIGDANVTFGSTVNGAFSLAVNTGGTTTFGGVVGGSTALSSLTTDAAGSTVLNGSSVTTTGAQSYNDAVTLGANTTLTSIGDAIVTFASTVNGAFSLAVNTAGTTTFGGVVGGSTALSSLTTDAAGSTALNGGSVTTTGAQSYNDAVTLGASTTLTSIGDGIVTFASTVNGAFSLAVNTGGTTTFGGGVGGSTAFSSLTTDAAGSTALNGGSVTTTGAQSYNDAVTLGANDILTSTGGGNLTFGSTVNGARTLTLVAGAGNISVVGAMGATTPLTSLTVISANNVTFSSTVATTGNVTQTAGTGATTFNGATIGGSLSITTNAITLNTSTVTSVGPVNLTAQNAVTLNAGLDATASTIAIAANQDGAGAQGFSQNAGSVTTTNNTASAVSITVNTAGGGTGGASIGAINANTGAGRVNISTNAGAITDTNGAANNLTANQAILIAGAGIGISADPIETTIVQLDVANTTGGGIFLVDLAGGLTLTDLGGPNANAVSGVGGNGFIRASSPLTIASDAITTGGMTYQATDSATNNVDNLTVTGAGTDVRDDTALTLNAGDDLNIGLGTSVSVTGAASTLTLNIDFGNADAGNGEVANINGILSTGGQTIVLNGGADNDEFIIDSNAGGFNDSGTVDNVQNNIQINGGSGANILRLDDSGDLSADTVSISNDAAGDGTILGLSAAAIEFNSFSQVDVNLSSIAGGANGDTLTVTPNALTTYNLAGNNPTATPGDQLIYDGTGTKTILGPGTGIISAPGVAPVNFSGFERVETTPGGLLNDVINIATLSDGFATGSDGAANSITIRRNPSNNAYLEILFDGNTGDANAPVTISTQLEASVNSLTINGAGDNDTLIIDDANGLPFFQGSVPGLVLGDTDNVNIPGSAGLLFNGAGGLDAIRYVLNVAGTNQTYAVGEGDGGGSGAGTSEGEILTANAVNSQIVYFTGLEPISTSGAPGGTLTVLGDLNANTITIDDSPVANNTRISAQTGASPFETFDFADNAFTSLQVFGMGGSDTIALNALDALETGLATIRLDGDSNVNGDPSADTMIVRSSTNLPATSVISLFGGPGNDLFRLGSTGSGAGSSAGSTVDNIAVAVNVAVGDDPAVGDADTLTVDDNADATADTVVFTLTTIDGITSFAGTDITYANFGVVNTADTINVFTGTGGDTVNIRGTNTLTTNNFTTGAGADTINIAGNAPTLLAGAGTLNAIDGQVNIDSGAAADSLNISDFDDSAGDTYTLDLAGGITRLAFNDGDAALDIRYNVDFTGAATASNLENFNLIGSSNAGGAPLNVYNINATTGTVNNTVSDGTAGASNNSTFNIQADQLAIGDADGATNTFNGNAGVDTFNLNFAANSFISTAANSTLRIDGGTPAATPLQRDRVNINLAAGDTIARQVTMTYQTQASGDVDLSGPAGSNLGLPVGTNVQLRTIEQVVYTGGTSNNDQLTVVATAASDLLSVTPLTSTSANVFIGGTPFLNVNNPPFTNSPGTNNPGMAGNTNAPGSSFGPDINLTGLVAGLGNGLTVFGGGGAADRLIVNAPTEAVSGAQNSAAWDATAGGGVGTSVVVAHTGVQNAYDVITANDNGGGAGAGIVSINDANGLGQLVRVNFNTASFAGTSAQDVVINSGEEADPAPGLVADDITVTMSLSVGWQINGGAPPLPGAPPLRGDRLNLAALQFGDINIFSDAAPDNNTQNPPNNPNVSITSTAPGGSSQPVTFNNIELLTTRPDNATQTVNIIGDNNGANPGQHDEIIVLGRDIDSTIQDFGNGFANPITGFGDSDGANEFSLLINGSTPIGIYNVRFLNVDTLAGDDDVTIDPYADNTIGGWGIQTNVDGGTPGANGDRLFYGNAEYSVGAGTDRGGNANLQPGQAFVDNAPDGSVSGVSESVLVQPTLTAGAGQVRSTNATDGSNVVTINYTNIQDLDFAFNDGSAGDHDSLTIDGTNAGDAVTANFGTAYAGAAGTNRGTQGAPWVTIADAAGALRVRIDAFTRESANAGANPTDSALSDVTFNLLDGDDTLVVVGPHTPVGGQINVAPTLVNYDGGTPSASDTLSLAGTINASDSYVITPGATSDAGTALETLALSLPTTINYTNLEAIHIFGGGGTGSDQVTLNGTGGPNAFTATLDHAAGVNRRDLVARVDAGPTVTAFDLGQTNATTNSSDVHLIGLGGDDTFALTQVSGAVVNNVDVNGGAPSGSDSALIVGTGLNDTFIYTSTAANAGEIDLQSPSTTGLTTHYLLTDVESAAVDGLGQTTVDTLVATMAGAVITPSGVSGSGIVTATDGGGGALLPLSYTNIENAGATAATGVFQGTAGNDIVTLALEDLDQNPLTPLQEVLRINGNPFDVTNFNAVVVNLLGGNDTMTIAPENAGTFINIPSGLTIIGGDSGTGGGDSVTITKRSNASAIVDWLAGTVANIVGGNVILQGVEALTINGAAAQADTFNVTTFGSSADLRTLTLNAGGDATDQVNVAMTTGPDLVSYQPTSSSSGIFVNNDGSQININGLTTAANRLNLNTNGGVDAVAFVGSAGADAITLLQTGAEIRATLNVNAATWLPVEVSNNSSLAVSGLAGNDILDVDNSGGLISLPGGITFDGGNGSDLLRMHGYTAAGATTYNPGPVNGAGTLIRGAQQVQFANLEPVQIVGTGAGDTLNIGGALPPQALNADNAINYTAGANGGVGVFAGTPNTGLVSVDAYETIEFANFGSLVINAGAGSDTINLNNPTTPTALTSITVNGGDPTGSDTVIVNGTTGNDAVTIDSLTLDGGRVTGLGPTINVAATEHLTYNGLGGTDTLTVTSPDSIIADIVNVTPGAAADSGDVRINSPSIGADLLPVSFINLGASLAAPGSLVLADGAAGNRGDVVIYHGTSGNDSFRTTAFSGGEVDLFASVPHVPVFVPGAVQLTMDSLAGDDDIEIDTIDGTLPYSIDIIGGDPSGSDSVHLFADGTPVNVFRIDDPNVQIVGGGLTTGVVSIFGVENISLFNLGDVMIDGFFAGAIYNVTPVDTNEAILTTGTGPKLDVFATGTLLIDDGGVADSDTLVVNGTTADETITVDDTAGAAFVQVGSLKRIDFSSTAIESLRVNGNAGSDTFNVTPGASPIFIDGGDPIGVLPGDSLSIVSGGGAVAFAAGPESDEGGFTVTGGANPGVVSFDHIETLGPISGPSGATITGTNGDDAITIIARDATYNLAADGVQDFTVSVNGGPEILFIDTPAITVNALSGDDVITVRTPAPNGAVWNVQVTINGGPPTASDKVVVETPFAGNEIVTYTPTGINSGLLNITSLTSLITLTDVEQLTYNGTIDDSDTLTVATTNAVIVLGADSGDGVVNPVDAIGNALLGITYLHVPTVAVTGATAVIQGTDANDNITISGSGVVTFTNPLGFGNSVNVSAFNALVINALGGDDSISVNSSGLFLGGITVRGGEPGAGSDLVTIVNDPNPTVNFNTNQVTGVVGGPITLTGIETLAVNGSDGVADALTVLGYGAVTDVRTLNLNGGDTNNNDNDTIDITATSGPDTIRYTPFSSSTARVERLEGGPVVNITGFNNTDNNLSLDASGNIDAVDVVGPVGNDLIGVIQGGLGTRVTVTAGGNPSGGVKWVPLDFTSANALELDGGAGSDRFDIDDSFGAVALTSGITVDGGDGSDTLRLIGSTPATTDVYSVGVQAGTGNDVMVIAGVTQTVSFTNLEPVIDLVAANSLTVNASVEDDAINYTQGSVAANGLITISDAESIEFSNKATLTINALAGDDVINLNDPTSPTGLTDITVNGGDPTSGSDTLIVNGIAGTVDHFVVVPTAVGSSDIVNAAAVAPAVPTVHANGIEGIRIVGQTADADTLADSGTAGNDTFTVDPGADPASGSINGFTAAFAFTPVTFAGISGFVAPASSLTGLTAGFFGGIGGGGGSDTVVIDGAAADDSFNWDASLALPQIRVVSGGVTHTPVVLGGGAGNTIAFVAHATLRGLGGNDTFNLAGPQFLATATFDIRVEGGGSATGLATINYTAFAGAATTIDYGAAQITSTSANTVTYTGINTINETSSAANSTLTINGTAGPDNLGYTPTGPTAGTVTLAGSPTVNFTGVGSTFTLDAVGGINTVTVNGTSGNDSIVAAPSGANTTVQVGATKTVTLPTANSQALFVAGGLGNDNLTVNSTAGPVLIPITYDGGAGTNALTFTSGPSAGFNAANTATSDTYTPGAQLGSGTNVLVFAGGAESVEFMNLAPIFDLVPGPLVVNGTNADNAINYKEGSNNLANFLAGILNPTWGEVSVDSYEPIEFINKTSLTINGLAGRDTINVNNPNRPTGLTDITVNGGDPTASDTVIINGTIGADAVTIDTLTLDGARVTGLGPVVTITTTEHLTYNGLGGDDNLTVTTPAGANTVAYTPGATVDSASVQVDSLLPINFQNTGAAGTVTFADAGGRVDTLIYSGTSASDTFNVLVSGNVTLNSQIAVQTPGVAALRLLGLEGDDTFNVPGNHPFARGITVDGGDPSASDVLNFTATAAATVNLGASTVGQAGAAAVAYSGIEIINLNAGGVGPTVVGTSTDDDITVTVFDANSGKVERGLTVQQNGQVQSPVQAPLINYTNTGGNALNVDLAGGNDTLVVVGNALSQTFNINASAAAFAFTGYPATAPNTVQVDDGNNLSIDGTVTYTNNESLEVFGLEGNDTFNVRPGTVAVFVDGGDPIGTTAGDTIVLFPPGPFSIEAGPESDEGGLNTFGATQRVSWDHIEAVVAVGGGPVLILGSSEDDDITIIARDSTYSPLADGIQDFTAEVSDQPTVLYINQPVALVDALAGDDDIVVREPAPNNAVWNVQLFIAAGTPAAVTGDQGDVVELETPGTQTVIFTPNPAAIPVPVLPAGVTITPAAGGIDTAILNDTTNTSSIAIAPFTFTLSSPPFPAPFSYLSSPGGAEQIVYQGLAGSDNLTINGTSADDTTTINPTGAGSGSFRSGLSPAFDFTGATAVTVNGGTGGFDVVNINGTAGPDTVTSNATTVNFAGGGSVTFGANVDRMNLSTFDGADNITLSLGVVGLFKFVDAGADNDIVNLSGVTADATIFGGDGDDTITGSPTADFIDGGRGNDTITGLGGNDTIYGGEGDDTITGGTGADQMFGGDGSDIMIWNQGDGSDVVEGGNDIDQLLFNGATAAQLAIENFTLTATAPNAGVGSRLSLQRTQGNINMDVASTEDIVIAASDGADTFLVNDLTATDVRTVDIGLSVGAGGADAVTIEGRNLADNLLISTFTTTTPATAVKIAGLRYDVNIIAPSLTRGDTLRVDGNSGDDTIKADAAVEANIAITLDGGLGNDFLSADATLLGGDGNDTLQGGAGNDIYDGGAGEDILIASGGADILNGGPDFDTFVINGTAADDTIDVQQNAPGVVANSGYTLGWSLNGVANTDTITQDVPGLPTASGTHPTVEQVRIQANQGNDLIRVGVSDVYSDLNTTNGLADQSVRFDILGDAPNASDRLVVQDDGAGDLDIIRQAADQRSGRVTIGGLADVVYQGIERLDISSLNPVTGGTGTDGNGRIVVFHSDPFEFNDSRSNAGQLARITDNPTSPNIDPGASTTFALNGDEDWYQFRPASTNTFQIKILFDRVPTLANGRPGLPGTGDLSLDIYDANGNLIVSGVPDANGNNRTAVFGATNDPAFPQFNRIFVRVKGAGNQPTPSINVYDFDNLSGAGSGIPGVSVVDNLGPQVIGVDFPANPAIDIFTPKPITGPSPLVQTLEIHLVDRPARAPGFAYPAIDPALFNGNTTGDEQFITDLPPAMAFGLFSVIGDQVGNVPIVGVSLLEPNPATQGQFATATITLFFDTTSPLFGGGLLDDRYTLTILDGLYDPPGNKLDGESNAAQPNTAPSFPSGNGQAGGNFVARFTVDARPHIGAFGNGTQQLDVNGNGIYDPVNADVTNADKSFNFGRYTDNLFAGNFAPAGQNGNGFDKLGAYGVINGRFRFLLATGGIADTVLTINPTLQINGRPVAYAFNPNIDADEIAVFDGKGNWYIDFGHNNNIGGPGTIVVHDGLRGYPVVGDFDGSGTFDLATYQPDTNTWQFDLHPLTNPGVHATLTSFGFPGIMERPVAADMNHDGITDIGMFVPTSNRASPTPGANWYFLESPGPGALPNFVPDLTSPYLGTINAINHAFNPAPFSQDHFYDFGSGFFQPIVGVWDPPTPPTPPVLKLIPGTFTNVSLSALVDNVPNGGSTGLVARRSANGKNEYWGGVVRDGNNYTAQIRLYQNGVWHTLASAPIATLTGRNTFQFDVVGTTLELSVNGSLVVSTANGTLQGAGAAGSLSDAGSIIWPAEASAISRPLPALPFEDSFTQAEGTLLGNSWDEWTGSFRTQGDVLVAQGAANLASLHTSSQADMIQSVDVTALPSGGFAGLLARYNTSTGAFYRGGIDAVYNAKTKTTTYLAQIWRKQAGRWTLLASRSVSGGTGTLTFVTMGASQQLFQNGTLVAASSDTALKTGAVGLYATQGVGFDNFAARQPALIATSLPFADTFIAGMFPSDNWYANAGGFAMTGSGALSGMAKTNELTLFGASQLNVSVQTQVSTVGVNATAGLLARYNTANGNTYWAGIVAHYNALTKVTTYTAEIRRRVNGVWTVLFRTAKGVHPGLLRFDVSGNQLSLFLNGTLLGSVRNGTLSTAGAVGLSAGDGGQVDGFSAS